MAFIRHKGPERPYNPAESALDVAQSAANDAGRSSHGADGQPHDVGGAGLSTWVAVAALLLSLYSLYETSLRPARITAFATPVMQYADPDRGPFEVFSVPLTFANAGASIGTILNMELVVTNPRSGAAKRFYAAALGRWGTAYRDGAPAFTPIAIPGRGTFAAEVLFYPIPRKPVRQDDAPSPAASGEAGSDDREGGTAHGETAVVADAVVERIIDLEAGRYAFDLSVQTVIGAGPSAFQRFWLWLGERVGTLTERERLESEAEPTSRREVHLRFERSIEGLDYRRFNNGGTIQMTGF